MIDTERFETLKGECRRRYNKCLGAVKLLVE